MNQSRIFIAYFSMLILLGYSLAWIHLFSKASGERDVAPALGILAIILTLMFWPAFIYGWRKFRTHRRLLLLSAPLPFLVAVSLSWMVMIWMSLISAWLKGEARAPSPDFALTAAPAAAYVWLCYYCATRTLPADFEASHRAVHDERP